MFRSGSFADTDIDMPGVKVGCAHCVGWLTLCDPIWQVTLRSRAISINSYTYLYLFTARQHSLLC